MRIRYSIDWYWQIYYAEVSSGIKKVLVWILLSRKHARDLNEGCEISLRYQTICDISSQYLLRAIAAFPWSCNCLLIRTPLLGSGVDIDMSKWSYALQSVSESDGKNGKKQIRLCLIQIGNDLWLCRAIDLLKKDTFSCTNCLILHLKM